VNIEDEKIIAEVSKKVQEHYERRIKKDSRNVIKVGSKVFLVGDVKLEKGTNKIIPEIPKLKNKLEKNRKTKILAKVIDINNIDVNEVKIKIFNNPPTGMKIDTQYSTQLSNLALAKNERWEALLKKNY